MNIILPDDVKRIINSLESNGYEAYAVGGCVRDAILGRVPQDWDITTSAGPDVVKSIFNHTVDTGIQHGTVTVLMNHTGYEVTTYRIDGEYEDCRHPKEVVFTAKLSEDLLRRDFTINAMAYNDKNGLVDIFNGRYDLEKKIIRCVGRASERFDEDALRILRAYRFAAQLDFEIDKETEKAASERVKNLRKVSAERIRVELNKLLLSEHPEMLIKACRAGVTKVVLPEFDSVYEKGEEYTASCMSSVLLAGKCGVRKYTAKERQILKWAALLSAYIDTVSGDAEETYNLRSKAREVMARLKFDNETRDVVTILCGYHNSKPESLNDGAMRRFMNKVGPDICPLLFELKLAKYNNDDAFLKNSIGLYNKIVERGDCVLIKDLKVTGSDLISEGFEKGPLIGDILDALLEKVIEDRSLNDKSILIDIASATFGK